jgi:hypothetical protein
MRSPRHLVTLTAAVAALLLLGTTAEASVTVALGPQATLIARGAVIAVPVQVTCSAPSIAQQVYVQVIQSHASTTTSGYGYTSEFTCDGTTQNVVMNVTPCNYQCGAPWRTGSAFAEAFLTVCHTATRHGCSDLERAEAEGVIRIGRG